MNDWGRASKGLFIARVVLVFLIVPILFAASLRGQDRPGYRPDFPTSLLCLPLLIVASVVGWKAMGGDRGLGWRDDVAVVATAGAFVLVGLGASVSISNKAEARQRFQLRQVMLALNAYKDDHGHYPPPVVRDKAGRPLYSWRVLILPYLDRRDLFERYRKDEPWDSPHNSPLVGEMPFFFSEGPAAPGPGLTRIMAFVGPGAAFEDGELLDEGDFRDPAHSMVMLTLGASFVPWTMPLDIDARDKDVARLLHASPEGSILTAVRDGDVRSMYLHDYRLAWRITRSGGEENTGQDQW